MAGKPIAFLALILPLAAQQDLYLRNRAAQTRWSSFENLNGAKGRGGQENAGAKGHPSDTLKAGETKTLLTTNGPGAIRRMWFTLRERNPAMLRSLRLEMYWDGAATPAVSVPFGDFFAAILGRPVAFENELFANPEGRSFVCYIPMPFRKSARVTLANEAKQDVGLLFYDIDYVLDGKVNDEALYFHATWRRERWTQLGKDFEILPRVAGEGRFLGAHIGVMTHPDNAGWWGEGEIKMYLDGDAAYPTLVGTGTEDYIGTGWGQGKFTGRYQGCLVADARNGQWSFYRYHIPDPVWFHRELRVTMQQMGGDSKDKILGLLSKGVALEPVTVADGYGLTKLMELTPRPKLADVKSPPNAWTNTYRRDDWSAVAFFYVDKPANGLPPLAPVERRTEAMADKDPDKR